jgi:hypothetical protein
LHSSYPAQAASRRTTPRWLVGATIVLWIVFNVALCVVGAISSSKAVQIYDAYNKGVGIITAGHFLPGSGIELLVLGSVLASLRWLILASQALLHQTPIEVRSLENSTGLDINIPGLDQSFRDYLSGSRIYRVTALPGDPDPDRLVEILKAPSYHGWRAVLASTMSYALPRRSYIVTATLRLRDEEPCYGVAVQIRKLPGYATELESQWSQSFDRALKRAAFAVGAYILPQTRHRRDMPWAGWSGRTLPSSLFRDYQRAKNMVGERRYDEALFLYHSALMQDANNIPLRYDMGQLYERLGLYPDALTTYFDVVNEVFPIRADKPGTVPRRAATPTNWAYRKHDPFIIRYRFVVTLGMAPLITKELFQPAWDELRAWLSRKDMNPIDRPWRVTEIRDTIRILNTEMKQTYHHFSGTEWTEERVDSGMAHNKESIRRVAIQMLRCALEEAASMEQALRSRRLVISRFRLRRQGGSLTVTAISQARFTIECRLKRQLSSGNDWRVSVPDLHRKLQEVGYDPERSKSWLEHYNAACTYALALADDESEDTAHLEYAYAAVDALERALRCGEDVDFVRSKRYWLQAGDPDLNGLRSYSCFRAFEARVYGRPLPAFGDIGKYELYLYIRKGLEEAAGSLSAEWSRRSSDRLPKVPVAIFERWWWQEERAWQLVIRLGKYYQQWQTRWAVHRDLRGWMESFGTEVAPFPYPNLIVASDEWDVADVEAAAKSQSDIEHMFRVFGMRPQSATNGTPTTMSCIMKITADWYEYARQMSLTGTPDISLTSEITEAIAARSGVWSAIRQWAELPSERRAEKFDDAARRLVLCPAPQ